MVTYVDIVAILKESSWFHALPGEPLGGLVAELSSILWKKDGAIEMRSERITNEI